MPQIARILLVEPDEALRGALDRALDDAGYEVASVADPPSAQALLHDGLRPDVLVVDDGGAGALEALAALAPGAVCLPFRGNAHTELPAEPSDVTTLDPETVVERVEEMLLGRALPYVIDDRSKSLDLASRLGSAMPRAQSVEERIEILTHGFDAFFGVRGTLVLHRSPDREEGVEANRGLSEKVVNRIVGEIERRSSRRGLRPFLTELTIDGAPSIVAALAVQWGPHGVDLALVLERGPSTPGRADALMNVVGTVMRTASFGERLSRSESELDRLGTRFERLVSMSTEFSDARAIGDLADALFAMLRGEFAVTRAALYTWRDSTRAFLDLRASIGFDASILDRLGLSSFHGVGRAVFEAPGAVQLSSANVEGAAHELRKFAEAALHWAAPIATGTDRQGLLFFGAAPESANRLESSSLHFLAAMCSACGLAIESIDRLACNRGSREGAWRSLIAALDLGYPGDRGHSNRVADHAKRMGQVLGMVHDEFDDLALSARLHDVGKIGTATAEAASVRRSHPIRGSQVLSGASLSTRVLQGVEQHHERWDGAGFPYGIRREEIHTNARIIAVANAYDRMRHDPREPLDRETALHRLELMAGLSLDPGLVAVFSSDLGRNPDRRGRADDAAPLPRRSGSGEIAQPS